MSKVQKLLIIIFGVVLVLGIAFCIVAGVTTSVPKLDPAPAASAEDYTEDTYETTEATKTYDAFSLATSNKSGSASTDKKDSTTSSSEYLCESLSEKQITATEYNELKSKTDTSSLPEDFAQMLINELYAKHGYKFKTASIQAYFDAKSWYKGTSSDMNSVFASMNSVEQANVEFLMGYTE